MPSPETVTITLRLSPTVLDELRQAADESERTVSGEIRYAVSLWLRRREQARQPTRS